MNSFVFEAVMVRAHGSRNSQPGFVTYNSPTVTLSSLGGAILLNTLVPGLGHLPGRIIPWKHCLDCAGCIDFTICFGDFYPDDQLVSVSWSINYVPV